MENDAGLNSRQLAERLGISNGLAHDILIAKGAPDRAKFRTEDAYLRKLCRNAVNKGHQHPALYAMAGEELPDDLPPPSPARAPAQPQTPAVDGELSDFAASLANLRQTVAAIGNTIAGRDPSRVDLQPILDRYVKLQQELRQSEKHYLDLQTAYANVYTRADAQRAAIQIWITLRAALDTIVARLAQPVNLHAWIVEAGGTLPEDSRVFEQVLRRRIYALVSAQVNQLADALAGSAVPEGVPQDAPREAMIEELQRAIAELSK